MTLSSVRNTREYAPRTWLSASVMRPTSVVAVEAFGDTGGLQILPLS